MAAAFARTSRGRSAIADHVCAHDASSSKPLRLSASMIARLLLIFSLVSLLIAAIGQYAVVAFNMRRRIREFGVRIASRVRRAGARGRAARRAVADGHRPGVWPRAERRGRGGARRCCSTSRRPTRRPTPACSRSSQPCRSLACCLPARGASACQSGTGVETGIVWTRAEALSLQPARILR